MNQIRNPKNKNKSEELTVGIIIIIIMLYVFFFFYDVSFLLLAPSEPKFLNGEYKTLEREKDDEVVWRNYNTIQYNTIHYITLQYTVLN